MSRRLFFATISELRSFTTKAREFAVSIGVSQLDDRSTWSQDQVAQMDEFFATEATNGFSSAAFTIAHNRGVDTCLGAAQDLIDNAYGTPLPSEIETQLSDALSPRGILTKLSRLSRSLRATFRI